MLRITTRREGGQVVMKLEGWLREAWVEELDRVWRQIRQAGAVHITVDLAELYFADEAGCDLLTRMYGAGVEFSARGCLMPEIVRQMARRSGA